MAKGEMINPFNVELCAVLERALNYIHSGNTKVIAMSIMNPMWIGRALIKDGLPSLNETMVKFFSSSWQVQGECLPYNISNGTPNSAAAAVILFNYDRTVYNVSLHIQIFQNFTQLFTDLSVFSVTSHIWQWELLVNAQ